MNEYELREVTRLVGESLVDLDVEDGSDVIVVAGELVDAQDFDAFVADMLERHYDPAYRKAAARDFAGPVTESADSAHSYYSSTAQLQETCSFLLSTVWLLTVPFPLYTVSKRVQ